MRIVILKNIAYTRANRANPMSDRRWEHRLPDKRNERPRSTGGPDCPERAINERDLIVQLGDFLEENCNHIKVSDELARTISHHMNIVEYTLRAHGVNYDKTKPLAEYVVAMCWRQVAIGSKLSLWRVLMGRLSWEIDDYHFRLDWVPGILNRAVRRWSYPSVQKLSNQFLATMLLTPHTERLARFFRSVHLGSVPCRILPSNATPSNSRLYLFNVLAGMIFRRLYWKESWALPLPDRNKPNRGRVVRLGTK